MKTRKPIAVVFTKTNKLPEYTKLQQLDAVGVEKVYLLLSNQELMKALEKKYTIFDWSKPETVIEHYQSYLPNGKIKFEVINTGDITNEADKIRCFMTNLEDDNLINIVYCENPDLPWINDQLMSHIGGLPASITQIQFFGFPIYESSQLQLPCANKRRSPVAVDELLNRASNPVFCMKNSPFDIMYYQSLFNSFAELITLELNHKDESMTAYQLQIKYFIQMYEMICNNLKSAEAAFEDSHQKTYGSNASPGLFQDMTHQMAVQKKVDAENAFPELIKNMISLYREIKMKKQPANGNTNNNSNINGKSHH